MILILLTLICISLLADGIPGQSPSPSNQTEETSSPSPLPSSTASTSSQEEEKRDEVLSVVQYPVRLSGLFVMFFDANNRILRLEYHYYE